MYIEKLDDLIDRYNNKYHRTINVKPTDVELSTYIDFDVENNDKDHKLKVGDHGTISKYKNIFAKGYVHSKLVRRNFCTNTVPWTYVISDLKGEHIVETFYEKELQKTNQRIYS